MQSRFFRWVHVFTPFYSDQLFRLRSYIDALLSHHHIICYVTSQVRPNLKFSADRAVLDVFTLPFLDASFCSSYILHNCHVILQSSTSVPFIRHMFAYTHASCAAQGQPKIITFSPTQYWQPKKRQAHYNRYPQSPPLILHLLVPLTSLPLFALIKINIC